MSWFSECVSVCVRYSDLMDGGADQVLIAPFHVPKNNWRYFCFVDCIFVDVCFERSVVMRLAVDAMTGNRCSVRPSTG